MDELVSGRFLPTSIEDFRSGIDDTKQCHCDAVILGCTEILLIIDEANSSLPIPDSTRLLARAAAAACVDRKASDGTIAFPLLNRGALFHHLAIDLGPRTKRKCGCCIRNLDRHADIPKRLGGRYVCQISEITSLHGAQMSNHTKSLTTLLHAGFSLSN